MEIYPFLPTSTGFHCKHIGFDKNAVHLDLVSGTTVQTCPSCGQPSSRIHSRYTRVLSDLPWMGMTVHLRLQVRRFFCDNPGCVQRTFAERLAGVAAAFARKTDRLVQALCQVGFTVGGEAGSRLSRHLGIPASGDTILRLIRRAPVIVAPQVNVLGVDDWAWRKGQRYGTVLCDLERHCLVDLLPERSAEQLANWLKGHPEVRIISRDRGGYYIQGANLGASQATQVADRFHLLCNLREALVRMLDHHHNALRDTARAVAVLTSQRSPPAAELTPVAADFQAEAVFVRRAEQAGTDSRSRRLARYTEVLELHRQGLSLRKIARQMGMHRETVRRFLHADQFPERASRTYVRRTDSFVAYLRQRWEEGCRNARQLTDELRQRGFDGSYHMVRRRVARWREPSDPSTTGPRRSLPDPSPIKYLSSNQVAWLLLKTPQDRTPDEQTFIAQLWQRRPALKTATDLAQLFADLVHERQADLLDEWLFEACRPDVPTAFRSFAQGLQQDYKAVKAALSLEWSNGQVEGQINRLKLIKRQMYGRAGFELLRRRVLNTG